MAAPARTTDQPLPPEIAEKMEAAGFSPEIATLMEIIDNFSRLQAEARPSARRVAEPMWPLKSRLPVHVPYQTGLRAAERGTLAAEKIGGRWFVTDADMQTWLAATGKAR